MSNLDHLNFDVVVVGCGAAGLSAAASALEAGARVAVLERATCEERGGQTRWTESLMRMKSEDEVSDDLEDHFMANSGEYLDPALINEAAGDFAGWPAIVKTLNFTDPNLISTLVQNAGVTLDWLKSYGVRFQPQAGYFITTCTPRLAPVGGGLAIIEALAARVEKHENAVLHYCMTARSLIRDDSGAIVGLEATDKFGKNHQFCAKAVVLASGGFEGNSEMLIQYLGPNARYIRPVARGGYYNKGEGIRMAFDVGAASAGDFSSFHAEPLDPRSGAPEPIVLIFNYGILVNTQGTRFVDEAPSTVDATYESITRQILAQRNGLAWAIVDARINEVPNWQRAVRSDQPPVSATTLSELAEKLGLDPAILMRTVTDFNDACEKGVFDPLGVDGLRTNHGFYPKKSNWATPLKSAPFLAFPIMCGICFTFGGVRVDESSRALDTSGVPISGLYAAGEMTGLYYGTYTGSTSVLRSTVFGRIAGQEATALALA